MIKNIKIIAVIILVYLYLTPNLFSNEINKESEKYKNSIGFYPYIGGYLFEGNESIDGNVIFGVSADYRYNKHLSNSFRIGAAKFDAGKYYPSLSKDIKESSNAYFFEYDLLYHLLMWSDKRLIPFISGGLGAMIIDHEHIANNDYPQINYGAGLDWYISKNLSIRTDLRHILSIDDYNNNLKITCGIVYSFDLSKPVTKIKPKVIDNDNDGVIDKYDQCPNTPKNVIVDKCGCTPDRDCDDVPDFKDKCIKRTSMYSVNQWGCPKDSDEDGIPDENDKCPHTNVGFVVDKSGCPYDTDDDGVADDRDKCQNTEKNMQVDSNGCLVPFHQIAVKSVTIEFSMDSYEILLVYSDKLTYIAKILKNYKDSIATIEAYTDDLGPKEYNLKLSAKRAETMKEYFIDSYNFDPNRIKVIPHGELNPIADNATDEGRKKNRRAVITVSNLSK